ncbi:MAG TPA: response regulator [Candidatus Polarisedimenticolaceae bacterium]|nr:response regulator [Candidatus Polarisedimenticolaceae bacterium]
MRGETVVVIEDESDILEVLRHWLAREGAEVLCSSDGAEGLQRVQSRLPSLVLLDLMLPGLDGLEICRRLKSSPLTRAIPILMVSAKGEESDVVLGLELGADDYLTKPFSPKELVARVRAVLRRGPLREERGAGERIVREGMVIDTGRHQVLIEGRPVALTATELRLLHYLASHPGRVFTRDQLLDRVIGQEATVVERNVDVHVGAVRKKLGTHRELIETVRGVGYRFREDVVPVS